MIDGFLASLAYGVALLIGSSTSCSKSHANDSCASGSS